MKSAERLMDRFLNQHIKNGRLIVSYPSGLKRTYGDKSKSVRARLKRLPLNQLRNPTMFIGESYMSGNLQIAEDKLDAFFRLMANNPANSSSVKMIQKLPKRSGNSYKKQRHQISHHYDIGNDYYKLWLDKSLTYSCAYFHKLTDSLEKAQMQKIEHLLKKLQLKRGQNLLDIGSGWGTLAVTAAKQYGVKALGITLSQEQFEASQKLAKRSGVADLVEFKLMNYQDLPDSEQYDRIISVGMFEHVGRGNHDIYFKKVRSLLKDDGISVLHCITDMTDKEASPWIDKYIFPGGYLPTVYNIEKLLVANRFWSIDREELWQHYTRTLDIWRNRHTAHKQEIIKMYDETFYRMRDFWLAGSAAAFRYGDVGLDQFIFTKNKPEPGKWPLTREYLYSSNKL